MSDNDADAAITTPDIAVAAVPCRATTVAVVSIIAAFPASSYSFSHWSALIK